MRRVESGSREREGEPWSGAGYHHPSRAFLATSEKNQRENQGDCPLAWGTVCGQGGICLFFPIALITRLATCVLKKMMMITEIGLAANILNSQNFS
jgi:hypothetical protein